MTGSIALTCAQRDGRSYLSAIRYDGLARASRPQRSGNAAHVVLSHLGPGIIGGDEYAMDVRVERGASLVLTGQMATPVYARDAASSVDATWTVASGASLVVRAEPVMLDARARHVMRTTLDIAGDGSAILADIVGISPGARASLRTSARVDGRLVARDACDLPTFDGAVATVIIVPGRVEERSALAAMLQPIVAADDGVHAGIGVTGGAVIVRATCERVWPLQRFVETLVAEASALDGIAARGDANEFGQPRAQQRIVGTRGAEMHDLRDVVVAR